MKIKSESAYAWECKFGLCQWAEPSIRELKGDPKPSPEAKAVRVRIVKVADFKRLMKAAGKHE